MTVAQCLTPLLTLPFILDFMSLLRQAEELDTPGYGQWKVGAYSTSKITWPPAHHPQHLTTPDQLPEGGEAGLQRFFLEACLWLQMFGISRSMHETSTSEMLGLPLTPSCSSRLSFERRQADHERNCLQFEFHTDSLSHSPPLDMKEA